MDSLIEIVGSTCVVTKESDGQKFKTQRLVFYIV